MNQTTLDLARAVIDAKKKTHAANLAAEAASHVHGEARDEATRAWEAESTARRNLEAALSEEAGVPVVTLGKAGT